MRFDSQLAKTIITRTSLHTLREAAINTLQAYNAKKGKRLELRTTYYSFEHGPTEPFQIAPFAQTAIRNVCPFFHLRVQSPTNYTSAYCSVRS